MAWQWIYHIGILFSFMVGTRQFVAANMEPDLYDDIKALIVQTIKESRQAETDDPATCSFIAKELGHCDDHRVASECRNLCTKGEDLHTCSLLEPATHCKIDSIVNECPNMCALVTTTTSVPTTTVVSTTTAAPTTTIPVTTTTSVPTTTVGSTTTAAPTNTIPEGAIFTSSGQRFQLLSDQQRTWQDAQAACAAFGLQLAHPRDPIAVRRHLVNNIGLAGYTWMNAGGTGSGVAWADTGAAMSQSDPLWAGHPVSTYYWNYYIRTGYCVVLMTHEGAMNAAPNRPYNGGHSCSSALWPLCQHD